MRAQIPLTTLQRTLHQIDQMFLIGDDVRLVMNDAGNLTVFVNFIAWGSISLETGEFNQWPENWRYHIDLHQPKERHESRSSDS